MYNKQSRRYRAAETPLTPAFVAEPRPRHVAIPVLVLSFLLLFLGLHLFITIFRTNGSRTYWGTLVATGMAEIIFTSVRESVVSWAQ